jgi:hypothetical protein
VQGVTVISHFERVIDRLRKGNWFGTPPTLDRVQQTGPMVIGDVERDEEGEEVFNERKSLVFKKLAVRQIYDAAHETLVYVVYSRQVVEGSAKITSARSGCTAPRSPGLTARISSASARSGRAGAAARIRRAGAHRCPRIAASAGEAPQIRVRSGATNRAASARRGIAGRRRARQVTRPINSATPAQPRLGSHRSSGSR